MMIMVASIVGGIPIIIFMLALNMTVAVGTLNGILFYYVILLVIAVIVASECSSKFANEISEGNPVAVLATIILLS